ncbi:MAG: hypothetical protein ACJ768_09420 [Gaiellaceae bacterium]
MAMGQGQGGGLFALPDRPELGAATWGDMSGMHPDNPLAGGRSAAGGVGGDDYRYRKVAIAAPNQAPIGHRQHFSELLNFSGSPMPWILLAALAYFGIVHLHAGAKVGPFAAAGKVGK